MKHTAFLVTLILLQTQSAQAQSSSFEQRRAEMRRNFEQRRAEMHKEFERRTSGTGRTTGSSGVASYGSSGVTNHGSSGVTNHGSAGATQKYNPASSFARSNPTQEQSERMKGTAFNPLPFDATKAPSPSLCYMKFVQTANSATSMDSLFPYIPFSKARSLKEEQQQYDPALAAQHKAQYQAEKRLDADAITHLTQDPYSGELKRLKSIAKLFMRVQKAEINGNKAELRIATRNSATASFNNGPMEKFPYGTAKVEMIGEGSYWRMSSYNDDNINYKDPQ